MEVTNICILLNEKQDLYPLLDVDTSKILKLKSLIDLEDAPHLWK